LELELELARSGRILEGHPGYYQFKADYFDRGTCSLRLWCVVDSILTKFYRADTRIYTSIGTTIVQDRLGN